MNSQLKEVLNTRFLPFVAKPMRYTGAELNIVRKDLHDINLHGVFCFPDLYDLGMSHFGLQILYHIVNKKEKWALSRCFHPWADAETLMRSLEIPLYTLEYFTPIRDADWIGFSIQYELQYTNLINMIDLAGLEIYSEKRKESDPIIIAGGPCVGNPEPLAQFIDAFAIGDGEETIISFCETLELEKKKGSSRAEKLRAVSQIPGIYVPSLFSTEVLDRFVVAKGKVSAAKIPQLKIDHYPDMPLVPLIQTVHSRLAVEVMRGCTRGCRFCAAGYYYRPVRERGPGEIHSQIRQGVEGTGWRDVGLLSLSTADYNCLTGLLETAIDLKKRFQISLALPSTRIDSLSPEQFTLLGKVSSSSSLTIAPEAGSARLRRVINKDFTDEQIVDTVKKLLQGNIQTLKLYFMIGLPTEGSADIEAIIDMVSTIAGMVRARSKRRMVHVSISPFSPKPHTPFGRERMEPAGDLEQKGAYIKRSLRNLRNVKVSYRNSAITLLETVMARGDRRVGELIYKAWASGARFDGWDECFDINRWYKAAGELKMEMGNYLEKIADDQILPWSVVWIVSDEFLKEEKRKSLIEETTEDCRQSCTLCGVCGGSIRNRISDAFVPEIDSVPQNVESDAQDRLFYYRFTYRKGESVRFLGHLDMVAVLHRAFLMAGLPLAYSVGFNPHPRVSFGPPLPSGVIGEQESFDMVVTNQKFSDPLIVNRWLPNDLKVLSYSFCPVKLPSLSSTISAAWYKFFPVVNLAAEKIETRIGEIISAGEMVVSIEKKGEVKLKNIRPGILQLKPYGNGFEALLSMNSGFSCKPSELLSALFPDMRSADFTVIRDKCIIS